MCDSLLERRSTAERNRAALVGLAKRRGRQAEVLAGLHERPEVLFAIGQVEQRAGRGVEALALLELRARERPVPRLRELTRLAKEDLGLADTADTVGARRVCAGQEHEAEGAQRDRQRAGFTHRQCGA